ncbi:MAG TPA: serine hydrolase [Candidatus Binatia bacterium]
MTTETFKGGAWRRVAGAGAGLLLILWTVVAGLPAPAEASAPRLDPALHARALERAARLPRLKGLLLSVDGELVVERYFNGSGPNQWANLKSASKSVLSILMGIALDRGQMKGVDDTVDRFFPEYFGKGTDPAKKRITLEDLLTMRSGLESTSRRNYGRWVQSGNWVRHVLERPMVDKPGGRMIYSTGNSHVLSAALTRAAGMSTYEFARRFLAEPLGIAIRPWLRDPQGIYFGGNEMHLLPRAMLKIGELYRLGGRAGNKQVVSASWVRDSLTPRTWSRFSGRQYGYGWWIDTLGGHEAQFAFGHGGQFIFVVPDLRLTAVVTSAATPVQVRDERRHHQEGIFDLLEQDIIPALLNGRISRR